jgi:carboxymethylenebutenolidase
MKTIEAEFPRGTCPLTLWGEDAPNDAPVVLFFPDAFGPRPASFAVAEELSQAGWRVLMIDQFYDHIPYEPIAPKSIFEKGPAHDALMRMFGSCTMEKIDADVAATIAFAKARLGAGAPLAAIGYCMGGRYAMSAVCADPQVKFAGAFHAGKLAPEGEDGPHRRFAQARGRIYVAVAGNDPIYDAAEHGRLAEALRAADIDHMIETYHGMAHGWVFPDIPIYDESGAKRHMRRMKEFMGEVFG